MTPDLDELTERTNARLRSLWLDVYPSQDFAACPQLTVGQVRIVIAEYEEPDES